MGVTVPLRTLDKLSKIVEPADFETEVRRMIGNEMPEVLGPRVLAAVYIENEQLGTTGALVKAPDSIKESIWQSKTMLVLAVSPMAFKNDAYTDFCGLSVKPGDWITARISDTSMIEIKGMPCRYVKDFQIEGKVCDPRVVTS